MAQITVSEGQIRNYQAEAGLKLRIYCRRTFTASDDAVIVRGTVDASDFYAEVDCTVSGEVITHDAFTIDSTEDGSPDSSYYTFGLYDSDGNRIAIPSNLDKIKVPASPTTTTLGALVTHNQASCECLDDTYYTAAQIDEILEGYNDVALVATTVNLGVVELNYAAEDAEVPDVVSDNYPPIRVLRHRKYLESYDDDLVAALADIDTDEAVLVVSKPTQYTWTRAVKTSGPLTVDENYEIIHYEGVVDRIALVDGGTGYSTATNVPTLGGSGSGLTVDITFVVGGVITGITINNSGTDYETGDEITIDDGNGDAICIVRKVSADDFSNVGATFFDTDSSLCPGNAKGVTFTATGTTPTTWTNGTQLRHFLTIPSNVTLEFEGEGSLEVTGAGGGIFINALNAPAGNKQIFVSDGDGKILVDPACVPAVNVAWWGLPTGTDDTWAFVQARDCLAKGKKGGTCYIPAGLWYTDEIVWTSQSVIRGAGRHNDGIAVGTCIVPADNAAEYVGVFSAQQQFVNITFENLTLVASGYNFSNADTGTVSAFRWVAEGSTAFGLYFRNCDFFSNYQSSGAVPLMIIDGTTTWHEFVNIVFERCTWTCGEDTSCLYWQSSNTVGTFINPSFRANAGSTCIVAPAAGFLEIINPDWRGQPGYTISETEDRTITGAASITSGSNILTVAEDYLTEGAMFTANDIGRYVVNATALPDPGVADEPKYFIAALNSSVEAVLDGGPNGDGTAVGTISGDDLTIEDLGEWTGGVAEACIDIGHHVKLNIRGGADEGFQYFIKDGASDYIDHTVLDGCFIQSKIVFDGTSSSMLLDGCTIYSNSLKVTTGAPLVRMVGGTILRQLIRHDTVRFPYPDTMKLVRGNAWHNASDAVSDFSFCSVYHEGEVLSDSEPYNFRVNTPARFIRRYGLGSPDEDIPIASIMCSDTSGGSRQVLLRMGQCYPDGTEGRHYYDWIRDTDTGILDLVSTQADAFSGLRADCRVISQDGLLSTGSTGIGYGVVNVGGGGTVTQNTDKSTAVMLNKTSGTITMNNAALAAGAIVRFKVNNSLVRDCDVPTAIHTADGTPGAYNVWCDNANYSQAGFYINVKNESGGPLSEAIKIQFNLYRGASS